MSHQSKYSMVVMPEAHAMLHSAVFDLARSAGSSGGVNALTESALGRVLAADVLAPCDVPARPCSRLDGYAVHASDGPGVYPIVQCRRVGRAGEAAGAGVLASGSVAYITTGASLPPGADAIVKVEDTGADAEAGSVEIRTHGRVAVGEGVRAAGSDVRAGALLLPAGHVLSALDVGTLLSARITSVTVRPLLVIGVLSTGDELVDASGSEGASHEGSEEDDRVVDSNRPMLLGLLAGLGIAIKTLDLGRIADTLESTWAALCSAVEACDFVVTTGAVSMGDRDYIKPALEGIGMVIFGRLNMKPGKPTTLARVPRRERPGCALVFALPGNPVSAAVCFHMLLAPAVRHWTGRPWSACMPPLVTVEVAEPLGLPLDPERPEYHRAIVWWQPPAAEATAASASGWMGGPGSVPDPVSAAGGRLCAVSTGAQASSRMSSTTLANALLWLPAGSGRAALHTRVPAYLLSPPYAMEALPEALRLGSAVLHAGGECSCGKDHPDAPPAPIDAAGRPEHVLHGVEAGLAASLAGVSAPKTLKAPSIVYVRLAVITVSTSSTVGGARDAAGPAVLAALSELIPSLVFISVSRVLVPDSREAIIGALKAAVDAQDCGLVLTTGGTGLGPDDVTPEATGEVLHKRAPGLVHAMLAYGLTRTPMAALSRYEAGVRTWPPGSGAGGSLIINMPGSPKAVRECLEALRVVLPHAVALANGEAYQRAMARA
jgi:gephyrin